jgi:hypothetical protein
MTLLLATKEQTPETPTMTGAIPPAPHVSTGRPLAPAAAFTEITQRPLFLPNRRPEPRPPPPQVSAESKVQPAPTPVLSATLVGVLMTPAGNVAIFRLPDGKSTTVPEGGSVQGWAVKQVLPDHVSLSLGPTSAEIAFPTRHPSAKTSFAQTGSALGEAGVPVRRRR